MGCHHLGKGGQEPLTFPNLAPFEMQENIYKATPTLASFPFVCATHIQRDFHKPSYFLYKSSIYMKIYEAGTILASKHYKKKKQQQKEDQKNWDFPSIYTFHILIIISIIFSSIFLYLHKHIISLCIFIIYLLWIYYPSNTSIVVS